MIDLHFLTLHPQFIEAYLSFGVCRSATEQGIASLRAVNLRDFAVDQRGSIDDRPYGGGDGMVMRCEPIYDALRSLALPDAHVILTAPGAKMFEHADAERLARVGKPLVFVCGRFGGVDQRVIDRCVDEVFSLGDFVVSGGELPSLMIADAILRQMPGVLGHKDSATMDSFAEGLAGRIEHPLYTKPAEWQGVKVPEVLLSGDHALVKRWQLEESESATKRFHNLKNKR